MMRNLLCLLVLAALLSSCNYGGGRRVRGNGNVETESRSVGTFEAIRVMGSMDVVLSPGSSHAVRVEADENLLNYIVTERNGDALEIRTRDRYSLRPSAGIKVYVTAPLVDEILITGSGSVVSEGRMSAKDQMRVRVTGSGDVKLDVNAPGVDAQASGSGNIILAGVTRNFKAEINGSGAMRCFDLKSETADVDISGSGSAEVFASRKLDVAIHGSGDVAYKGAPAVNQRIAGSGAVRSVQ
jgi:hypothetical protein